MNYNGSNYNEWVNYEYDSWASELNKILQDVELFKNFKQNPQIKRMLGASDLYQPFLDRIKDKDFPWKEIEIIDSIGNPPFLFDVNGFKISGITLRYLYYADKICKELINYDPYLKFNFVEIGGGYGGFASILLYLLENKKFPIVCSYSIFDIEDVQCFQNEYLNYICNLIFKDGRIKNSFELFCFPEFSENFQFVDVPDYLVSFYALGEFPKELKHQYIHKLVSQVPHGFIIWNPHFEPDNESVDLILKYHPNATVQQEDPLTAQYNLEIKW